MQTHGALFDARLPTTSTKLDRLFGRVETPRLGPGVRASVTIATAFAIAAAAAPRMTLSPRRSAHLARGLVVTRAEGIAGPGARAVHDHRHRGQRADRVRRATRRTGPRCHREVSGGIGVHGICPRRRLDLDLPMIGPPTGCNLNGVPIPLKSTASLFDLARGAEVLPGHRARSTAAAPSAARSAYRHDARRWHGDVSCSRRGRQLSHWPASRWRRTGARRSSRRSCGLNGAWRAASCLPGAQAAGLMMSASPAVYRPQRSAVDLCLGPGREQAGAPQALHSTKPYLVAGSPGTTRASVQPPPSAHQSRRTSAGARPSMAGGSTRRLSDAHSWSRPHRFQLASALYWLGSKPTEFGEDIQQQTHELRLAATQGSREVAGRTTRRGSRHGRAFLPPPRLPWSFRMARCRRHPRASPERLGGVPGEATYAGDPDRLRLVGGALLVGSAQRA